MRACELTGVAPQQAYYRHTSTPHLCFLDSSLLYRHRCALELHHICAWLHLCAALAHQFMCLQVGEKRQDNSGIMQGQLIKRTHIPKPVFDSDGWGTVNPADAPNGTSSLLKTADPPSV